MSIDPRAEIGGKPIGVIGVGYVGLVTAVCFADLGYEVICRDIDAGRIEGLRAGHLPIYEPDVEPVLARNRDRLEFTLDLEPMLRRCKIVFVCVDTPQMHSGDADLSRVHTVIDELSGAADDLVLVMKSTVPVGTGDRLREELQASGREIAYVSNPEFLREGRAVTDFAHPDRIVIGAYDPVHGDAVEALYAGIDAPVIRTDVASAEMTKYASNAFLAAKISFVNEIANVCEEVGADVSVVTEGMGLDTRIGPHFLRPGIGYGGSCFPKDVRALKQLAGNTGYHFQLLTAVIEVNELQKRRLVGKLEKHLGPLRGRRVAVLGLAFKANTDDMREAASLVLCDRLRAEGTTVVVYDPVAMANADHLLHRQVERAGSMLEAVTGADAAVIVTEWDEFRDLASPEVRDAMAQPLIVDGRNLLDPAAARAAGFAYESVGRPSDPDDVTRIAPPGSVAPA
jgi:UDPglucose 6-dehydrogenase